MLKAHILAAIRLFTCQRASYSLATTTENTSFDENCFQIPFLTGRTQIHPVEGEANGTVCSGFVNGLSKHFSIRGRYPFYSGKTSQLFTYEKDDSDPLNAFVLSLPP
jgi:hypothetical protein